MSEAKRDTPLTDEQIDGMDTAFRSFSSSKSIVAATTDAERILFVQILNVLCKRAKYSNDLERRLADAQAGETEVLQRLDALLAENAAKAATITLANADIAALRESHAECRKMLEGEHDAHMECHARAETAERHVAELEAEKQAMVEEALSIRERSSDIERRIAEVEAGAKDAERWRAHISNPTVWLSLFLKAPCFLCGYNSLDYFQSAVHPCAATYHNILNDAAREKEKSNG